MNELIRAKLLSESPAEQLCRGFYPRVYAPHITIATYYQNYISTYVERDIRSIKNIENILAFKKFMQLCALRIGSPLNFTDLATNCGISILTAKNWLGLLETSFIIFLLPSYHENLGKRITKSPKLYFYDVGLAAALLGLDYDMIIKKREVYGALFENMVIVDLIKNFYNQGKQPLFTFFRDSNQNEIDLIIEMGGKIVPLEIKASETIQHQFFHTLIWFKEKTKSKWPTYPTVVYGGDQRQERTHGHVIPWTQLASIVTMFSKS